VNIKIDLGCGVFVLLAAFATTAGAGPITYTFTATGSGTIGADSFTNGLATVTGVGDTSGIFVASVPPFSPNTFVIDPTLSITISGVGIATFTGTSSYFGGHGYVFDNQTYDTLGFGIESDDEDAGNPLFATYALATSIGPVAGSDMSFSNEATSLGPLTFTTTTDGTFTAVAGATVALEPSGLFLMLGGLGFMILRMARRGLHAQPRESGKS